MLWLLALLWLGSVRAQDGEELLLLDLCLDRNCLGVVPVLVVGEELWIDRDSLDSLGLSQPTADAAVRTVRDRPFVRVADLAEIAWASLDRERLRLDLARRPETLPMQARRVVRLHQAPDTSGAVRHPVTASLDYAASLGDLSGDNVFVDGKVGRGHLVLRGNAAWDGDEGWRRGLTRLEFDQPERLRRWSLGDQFATSPELLAGSVLLAGFGVERSFEQDPFLVTFPQPYLAGVLELPGTVEIYSNGVLIGRQSLSAGPFSLENIGLPAGRSDVELVFRDSFGNRRQLDSQSFYAGAGLLAKGLSDYALRVGLPRDAALGGGYDGELAVQGWYRRGLSDGLTLGAAFEADGDGRAGHASLAAAFGGGEIGLSVAYADSDFAAPGLALAASYGYQRRGFGLGLGWRWREAGFRALGEPARSIERAREDAFASLGFTFANSFSIRANASRNDTGGSPATRNVGLDFGYRPLSRLQTQLSIQRREQAEFRDTVVLLNLAWSFDLGGSRWRPSSASFGADWRDGGEVGVAADLRRFRPLGEGYGYDLSLREGAGPGTAFARAEYQGRYGRYTAEARNVRGFGSEGRIEASGSITAIGGRAYFSPPTESGFALVRVPDMPGVEVLRENQPVGRTDARGDLLVRNLLPFYPNRIAIDADSVPVGHRHGELSRWVHSPHGTGSLVEFDVRPLRAAFGWLVAEGASPLALARVIWSSTEGAVDYFLGGKGRFYQEDLPPGPTEWRVVKNGGEYLCRFEVPARPGLHQLGTVACITIEVRYEAARGNGNR